jgi:Tfp pilus assembly protein PilF
MDSTAWYRNTWLGILLVITAGCASPWSPRNSTTTESDSSAVSPNGGSSKAPLQVSNQAFGTPTKSSAWSTLQGATNGLAEALTIKPKVIPARDPTSLTTDPADIGPELYIQLARQFESGGLAANALKQYQRALDLEPDNVDVLISMARLLDRERQPASAIQYYRRAVLAAPERALVHNDLGLCYARCGQTDNALTAFREAVRLEPTRDLYRNNLATSLVHAGQPAEALTHLRAVHAEAVARYNLGYLLQQNGQPDAARQQFLAACQADPRMLAAQEMLRRSDASRQLAANGSVRFGSPVAGSPAAGSPATSSPANGAAAPVAYRPDVQRLPVTTATR